MFGSIMQHFEAILTLMVLVCGFFYVIEGLSYRKQRKRLNHCFAHLQETANERQEYALRLNALNPDRLNNKQTLLVKQTMNKLKSNSPLNDQERYWLKHPVYPLEKFIEFFAGLFWILFFVWFVRSFLWEPFQIPSDSMLPTLRSGDFISTQKFSYGVRLPVFHTKIIETGRVQRGDVIVFRYPKNEQINFIKRVIGLPGDVVRVERGQVSINGEWQMLTPTSAGDVSALHMQEDLGQQSHWVQFLFNRSDTTINPRAFGPSGEWHVPEDHYFVMGDNRDNSEDSRYWGFVPDANLVGKATHIWMNRDCITGDGHCERIGQNIQ